MTIKYDIQITSTAINQVLGKITNQIFKLLPIREEGADWETPLKNLIIDLKSMNEVLLNQADFFSLICKMESLFSLSKKEDFLDFRRTIFECLNLLERIRKCLD